MREIKLRGYAIDEMVNSQWLHGTGILISELTDEYAEQVGMKEEVSLFTESGWALVHKESVGQYTGLKDKNGIEVYEGDVLQDKFGERLAVKFHKLWGAYYGGNLLIKSDEGKLVKAWGGKPFYNGATEFEIIGNVYENPKLLESEE